MALAPFLVTERSFDETGTLREPGSVGYFEAATEEDHTVPIAPDMEIPKLAIAAVGPAGPNPKLPQQIPPDAFQLPDGYGQPLARLVPEINIPIEPEDPEIPIADVAATAPEEAAAQTQALLDAIADKAEEVAENKQDAADLDFSGKSDKDLAAMRDKEINQKKPNKAAVKAINEEIARRPKAEQLPASNR